MTIAILIAIQAPPFVFEGGSVDSFVRLASSYTHLPFAMMVDAKDLPKVDEKWPLDASGKPLSWDLGLKTQMGKVGDKLGHTNVLGESVSSRPKPLPWYRFSSTWIGRNPAAEYPDDSNLVSMADGKVTTRSSKSSYYLPAYLTFLKTTKRVTAHRFLQMTPLAFSDSIQSESSFIDAVCAAIGGKKVENDSSIFIDVDTKVFREQMIERFLRDARTTKSKLALAKAEFQAEAMKIVPDQNLRSMIDKENYLDAWALPVGSEANKKALNYAKAYVAEAAKTEGRDPLASPALAEKIQSQGNFSRAFRVVLITTGKVDCMIMYGSDAGGVGF